MAYKVEDVPNGLVPEIPQPVADRDRQVESVSGYSYLNADDELKPTVPEIEEENGGGNGGNGGNGGENGGGEEPDPSDP